MFKRTSSGKSVRKVRVREGGTGILYLNGSPVQERFIPNYDLENTRELLQAFQELKDSRGVSLKDNYWCQGDNWFPSMVSYLYWHAFFPYVKYKPLVDAFIDGHVEFEFDNQGAFYHLLMLVTGKRDSNAIKTAIFRSLVRLNNALAAARSNANLMFFRFELNDFRSVEIRRTLDELGGNYLEVVPPGRIVNLLGYLVRRRPYYYYGGVSAGNCFNRRYDFTGLDRCLATLFARVVENLEFTVSGYVKETRKHSRRLKRTNIKTLYGFDDSNGYIFPLLYACHRRNIKTVGHQHGAYVRRHAGYVMEGIAKEDFRWFDQIIVWGRYWKDHLMKISSVYEPSTLLVGANRNTLNYSNDGERSYSRQRGVLIPYEFTTNTYKVGRYMERLIELGYRVYFKPRSDEALEDQLEAYCLAPEVRQRLAIVEKIDARVMRDIDVVAGTMTTLVYELLPFRKATWIFDVEYKHLEDLVEQGLAYKVRYEDLATLDQRYFTAAEIDVDYMFDPESLHETLAKHVLTYENGRERHL